MTMATPINSLATSISFTLHLTHTHCGSNNDIMTGSIASNSRLRLIERGFNGECREENRQIVCLMVKEVKEKASGKMLETTSNRINHPKLSWLFAPLRVTADSNWQSVNADAVRRLLNTT